MFHRPRVLTIQYVHPHRGRVRVRGLARVQPRVARYRLLDQQPARGQYALFRHQRDASPGRIKVYVLPGEMRVSWDGTRGVTCTTCGTMLGGEGGPSGGYSVLSKGQCLLRSSRMTPRQRYSFTYVSVVLPDHGRRGLRGVLDGAGEIYRRALVDK